MPHFTFRYIRPLLASVAALLALPSGSAHGANYVWNNITGNWDAAGNWVGGLAPTGLNPADTLTFGGDVGSLAVPTIYTATNNLGVNPFLLNQFILQATDAALSGNDNILAGNAVQLSGAGAGIVQNGAGNFTLNMPVQLGNSITIGGTGTGTVTLNAAVSGAFDIVKNGPGTFRFGTPFTAPATGPSANTWFGTLTINEGTVRFNNNAQAGATALRANPVVMAAGATLLFAPKVGDQASSLRLGVLSGNGGLVQARGQVNAGLQASQDITIWTLTDGTFGGILSNSRVGGTSAQNTVLTVRGTSTQTFTGSLDIEKDVAIGAGATLVFGGNASLSGQSSGAVVLQGGAFKLDNATVPSANRLRDGASGSTGVDVIGGGSFTLVGNAAGISETVGRLQLGSPSNPRSGALTVAVNHPIGAGGPTLLNFQSYARDQFPVPLNTVDFTASNGNGNALPLGQGGNSPQIFFSTTFGAAFSVPRFNGLLGNTGSADATTVGWATVNGSDFASYDANGVVAVSTTTAPAEGTVGEATANLSFATSTTFSNAGGYAANSIKIAPTATGQSFNLSSTGSLITGAILLAGDKDFTIGSTGGGGIVNPGIVGPRYFHVQQAALTVGASLASGNGVNQPIVKAGAGTLVLTNGANFAVNQPFVINAGVVRAQPGLSLPFGELRLRGGVLEITGGGTFARSLGFGAGNLNWSGIDAGGSSISEERGSGGFAAFGADVTIDLNTGGPTNLAWEDIGFIDSGYALTFGSHTANARTTFLDNINLTQTPPASNPPALNYNAREIRVIDNPAFTGDGARLSGIVSGGLQNDLLKTGDGLLELTALNTYLGATLVHEGTLAVNGVITSSFLTNVQSSAQLIGNGAAGAVKVENGGTLAPGDVFGHASIFNTANLTLAGSGAKLSLEIGGITAGGDSTTGYDLVNVTGSVTLNGATLQLSSLGGFVPNPGQFIFLVNNDGSDLIAGTFAQGATVMLGAQALTISYEADFDSKSFTGGNDIAVGIVPEPAGTAFLAAAAFGLAARRRRL
jgi:autotransporter-associated beta strand protein